MSQIRYGTADVRIYGIKSHPSSLTRRRQGFNGGYRTTIKVQFDANKSSPSLSYSFHYQFTSPDQDAELRCMLGRQFANSAKRINGRLD